VTLVFQYGGNPVSCAISLAVLDVLEEEGLLQHAKDVGGYLRDEAIKLMATHPIIGDVRYGCLCVLRFDVQYECYSLHHLTW